MNLKKKMLSVAIGLGLGMSVGFAGTASAADEVYIPLISKGFQHQFWQAVKAGADQAGKDFNVKVTFEGPETEAMVDKQIDMLSAALAKKPAATKAGVKKPVSPKSAVIKTTLKPKVMVVSDEQRYRMVAEAAYYRAESNQFKSDPLRDWIEAESDIAALLSGSK